MVNPNFYSLFIIQVTGLTRCSLGFTYHQTHAAHIDAASIYLLVRVVIRDLKILKKDQVGSYYKSQTFFTNFDPIRSAIL